MGVRVSVATPDGYQPDPQALAVAAEYGDHFTLTNDQFTAARDADVIFTDVWTSDGTGSGNRSPPKSLCGLAG